MYSKIYDFCKVRNLGNTFRNSPDEPTPRVQYLIDLLESEGIEYILDKFDINKGLGYNVMGYNLILKGDSNKMIVAHHDISNPIVDNANDNSASVINAIMVKKLMPHIHVVLLDGEECGGLGSKRLSEQIIEGYFGNIDWVLNLELTGRGGKYFFVGDYSGDLLDHIKDLFNCPVIHTPYNDSVTLRRYGIDSTVINSIPPLNEGKKSIVKWNENIYLDYSMLNNCHCSHDSIDTIDVRDMQEFVEEVLIKILSDKN